MTGLLGDLLICKSNFCEQKTARPEETSVFCHWIFVPQAVLLNRRCTSYFMILIVCSGSGVQSWSVERTSFRLDWGSAWLSGTLSVAGPLGFQCTFLSVNLEGSRPVCPPEGHLVTMVTVFTMGKSELCLKTTLDILMVHFEIFILKLTFLKIY